MMCRTKDKVIGVFHEGLLGSRGIMNMLLLLALCGGNYFVLCNKCYTVLSVKQPLILNL